MTEQRLFVDCDDTLVLFDGEAGEIHPYSFWRYDSCRPNESLIAFIKKFAKEHPNALIVIWSGGGKDYAQAVANELLPDVEVAATIKDKTTFGLVRENDIVVDDQPIDVEAVVISPKTFDK